MKQQSKYDFVKGEVLLIDKPLEWTSFDVVNKIRYKLKHFTHEKKIKVGHAGTLDPLASGLLIVCTGKMTKNIDVYQSQQKEYTGTIQLGRETPSYDLETETCATHPTDHITETEILETAKSFIGFQNQIPPVFSAKKIDGKRAYDYARSNQSVEMKPKEIEIAAFEITKIEFPFLDFRISCSKGTYIRSIAHDFGKKLNNGACLTALRRTRIGDFRIENGVKLTDFYHELENMRPPITTKGIIFDFNRTIFDPEKETVIDGVFELLKQIKNLGIKMTLLSKELTDGRRKQITLLGFDPFFEEVVVTKEDKQLHHLRYLIKCMDLQPEDCMVVGDRVKSEIQIGNRLLMKSIWYRQGKFKDEMPTTQVEKPNHIITDIKEILDFL